jgi:hypothetical protein
MPNGHKRWILWSLEKRKWEQMPMNDEGYKYISKRASRASAALALEVQL